jgi:hypothetical protein
MEGIYQHRGESCFHRYLAKFDVRYNRRSAFGVLDKRRVEAITEGIEGKRHLYWRANEANDAEAKGQAFLRWRKRNERTRED